MTTDLTEYLDEGEVPARDGREDSVKIHALKDGVTRCGEAHDPDPTQVDDVTALPIQEVCLHCYPDARRDLIARLQEDLGIDAEVPSGFRRAGMKAGTNG